MDWVIFSVSAVILVVSATLLGKYDDFIAARAGMGRLFVGRLLLARATTLPGRHFTGLRAGWSARPNTDIELIGGMQC